MIAAARILCTKYWLNANHLDCAAHVLHNVVMKDQKDFIHKLSKQVDEHPQLSARGITVGNSLSKVRKIHGKLCYRLGSVSGKTADFKTLEGISAMLEADGANFDEAIEYLRGSSVLFKTENATRWGSMYMTRT